MGELESRSWQGQLPVGPAVSNPCCQNADVPEKGPSAPKGLPLQDLLPAKGPIVLYLGGGVVSGCCFGHFEMDRTRLSSCEGGVLSEQ